jgi:hypothetical protein
VNHRNGPPKNGETPKGLTKVEGLPHPAPTTNQYSGGSRQTSWWLVHQYIQHALAEAGSWPMVGTPAWCALDDGDPAKVAAIYDAAQHHALRLELNQEARCQASRDISAAADWSGIAQNIRQHNEFYAARPYLKRVAS